MKPWWTKERVIAALKRFHAETGQAPASSQSYDVIQRARSKGLTGAERPFPNRAKVLAHFPSFREAWKAAGIVPDEPPKRPRPPRDIAEGEKHCSRCKSIVPVELFGKNASRPRGLADYCKACMRDMYHKRRARELVDAGAIAVPSAGGAAVLARVDELTGRVGALERDRRQLLGVVRLLVEGDGAEIERARELVRVGIVIGAAARA